MRTTGLALALAAAAGLMAGSACSTGTTSSASTTAAPAAADHDHADHGGVGHGAHGAAKDGPSAMATIEARSGSSVSGTAEFHERGATTHVVIEVKGAAPGEHGLHLHEKGDCSAPDAASAGSHFNPASMPHGGPNDAQHHAGDLGNITVGADGSGRLEITTGHVTVSPGAHSVVGRAVILHAKADDMKTQPTGDAGGRIGCGVVVAK